MLHPDGGKQQNHSRCNQQQLTMTFVMMLVVMLMMMLMRATLLMMVSVRATLLVMVVMMMFVCHNFTLFTVSGCKVTAYAAQLGCKVYLETFFLCFMESPQRWPASV